MVDAMVQAVAAAERLVLTTPDVDGDSVGSLVGLYRAIVSHWPGKRVRVLAPEAIPARYAGLTAGVPFETPSAAVEPSDLAIVVDGSPDRLGPLARHFEAAARTGMVDHHKSSDPSSVDVALVDSTAASTTELVLRLCDGWGIALNAELAAPLFAGLVFDTSIFRYRLTTPRALRAAARMLETGIDHARIVEEVLLQQSEAKARLRARVIDRMQVTAGGRLAWSSLRLDERDGIETGGFVDDLVFVEGVEVGLLVLEKSASATKVSLRSRGGVDVAQVAQSLSQRGGGHARAAGATVLGGLEEVAGRAVAAVEAALAARG